MRASTPFLLLLLLHFALLSENAVAGGNGGGGDLRGDAAALLALKAALNCRPRALPSWAAGNAGAVCAWTGVRCAGGRVVAIDVANMNVSSSAPVSVRVTGELDALESLSLAGNGIVGAVAASSLRALRHVNVSGNQLGGGLDGWDFASLPSLEVFDAYDNNFSAPLPLGVASLPRLRYLDLGGNYFTGEIPAAYGGMPAVEYLSLNGNNLQGRIPPELGNLTTLRELYLGYYNVFDGGVPPELGRLRNLTVLDVSNCGLTGRVPAELGTLSSLDTLFLHTNQLTGPIPPELGNLTSLTALDLSNNALTGEVPRSLASLTSLKLLNLFLNRLHGPVPEFIAALPRLETVQLFMNNLTGRVPAGLGATSALRLVDLSSNRLTGVIPETLCASGELHTAILMNNFLFGPIPGALGSCASLTRVRLGQNYLNGSIPAGLLYLPRLNLLELQNNLLSGAVPSNPSPGASSSQLAQLNLSNNLLSGPLPTTLANLTALQTLLVSSNRLGGAVPPEVGELRRLVKLDLSGNALSGPIPAAVGQCGELTYLDLSRNSLSGPIPGAIAGIRVLNYLNLSRNALEDAIPAAIGAMSSLTAADFSYNNLVGRLPDTGQLGYLNATAFAGNPGLCGPVLSRPCNYTGVGGGGGGAASSPSAGRTRRSGSGELKLVLALGLLACSVVFAAAAVLRARSFRGGDEGGGSWRFTAFHKVDFGIAEVIECMKDGNVVGRGGAGVVYAGRTRSGGAIAVKRLQKSGHGHHGTNANAGGDDDRGFRAEVRTLGKIRHKNIVKLWCCCTHKDCKVLVYEYMGGGSLGEVLHGKGGAHLCWERRYRIALEAARGLCYLHHDCTPMIVHRDVKSNNILLGGGGIEARVADFGLAKFLRGSGGGATSECMSAVAGSYGYIAPEYAYTLRVDEKSDVYSYGVVLLELITGRRPVGDFGEGVDIVQWAKRATGGRREAVPGIADRRLGGSGAGAGAPPADEVAHLFFVSMLCVQENSVERPTMREVVQMLSEFPRHASSSPSTSSSTSAAPPGGEESSSPDDGKAPPANCYKLFVPDLLA
ncbi:Leucine-rich repeat receptor-like serine/threonine-protein kinase BAM1 [Dichanthelium oligosanthes]|uniref:non-specific serine/threonine protein kinase n=1 Tax=Dichanthelium oligosanthes TaxID=888268 RepID=A0A1E5VVP7_9POAL|nr:Leucine-rich repeat receptor-like serine/threonine-protein kinase BAM1 [Dichanthelium oligosanthes]